MATARREEARSAEQAAADRAASVAAAEIAGAAPASAPSPMRADASERVPDGRTAEAADDARRARVTGRFLDRAGAPIEGVRVVHAEQDPKGFMDEAHVVP